MPAHRARDVGPDVAHTADNPEVRHETTDVNFTGILTFAGGLIVAAIIIHVLLWLLFLYFQSREAAAEASRFPLAAEQRNRLPAEPRLQANPRQDLADLRAREQAILSTYGWVDKSAGVVRIPIEEAMRLTVERGLPARSGQETRQ